MLMKQSKLLTIPRATIRMLLATLLLTITAQAAWAQESWPEYFTDLILVGGSSTEVNNKKAVYESQGYTFFSQDFNKGARGDYILLGYKKGSRASTIGGYITDIIVVSESDHPKPTGNITVNGRTYKKVPFDGGDYFKNTVIGDLNSDAGGWGLWLYYSTQEYGSTKRAVTGISFNDNQADAVLCYNYWDGTKREDEGIDLNRGAGGDYIYMHLSTTTKTNRPSVDPVREDLNFNATNQRLIKTAATCQSGTVYYKLDNGNYTTDASSLTAQKPGSYTISYYVGSNSYGNASYVKSFTVNIKKDNAYIKAKNITVTNQNSYAKTMRLNWDPNAPSGATTQGKWYIYRDKEKIGEKAYSSSSTYFDVDLGGHPYNTEKEYSIVFVPNTWTLSALSDALDEVKASVAFNFTRSFNFSEFTPSESNGKVKLDWTYSNISDATTSHTYTFKVQRTDKDPSTSGESWADVGEVVVNSKNTITSSFTDQTALANQSYWYRVKIDVEETTVCSPVTTIRLNGSSITGFTASRGDFSNTVKLSWTVDQKGSGTSNFAIYRRPLGSASESDWAQIYTTSGNVTSYSYEDQSAQPGSFNEYRIVLSEQVEGKMAVSSSMTSDGFSLSTGVVSGRISFGSGTAVEGVRITMNAANADGESENHFRSLSLKSNGVAIQTTSSADKVNNLVKGAFSAQCYVMPDASGMGTAGTIYQLLNVKEVYQVLMQYDAENERYQLGTKINGTTTWSTDYVNANRWSHVTVAYADGKTRFYVVDGNGMLTASDEISGNVSWTGSGATNVLTLGNNSARNGNHFYGNVDEFRFFTKALTEADVLKNYNHTLAGSESGLVLYWPMDEGIANGQKMVYDFSRPNGVASGNHGSIAVGALSDTGVPSADQLSLMTYTDENGNYTIRGIGFSGEGTNYVVTPTMGIHQFSPSNKSRFFSLNSLVHSGVDFEDVSSFPVSGVVYYENTTIPVADVYVKVDGVTAARDGKAVVTNAKGEFSVDVPIGEHFVSIEKNGHTFVSGGRYPEDPDNVGVRHNFDDQMSGLTFYDNTLVTVAGRVAGGDIEYEKPLGVGQGKANIGKARLTLDFAGSDQTFINAERTVVGNAVSYNQSTSARTFAAQYGSAVVEGSKNVVTIETDATTGEFVAQLPPLSYSVKSIQIPSNTDIIFNSLPVIDATNPSLVYTDSVETEDGMRTCDYVASAKIEYKSPSKFIVTENEDGSFGIKNYKVKDVNGTVHDVSVYTVSEGNVNYTFGYPVYEELGTYVYKMSAYEEYVNQDNASEPVVDRVPLAGKKVTVQNQFASTTSVLMDGAIHEVADNTFELDDNGEAIYQFTVGYPNIQSPYTRGLTITYDNSGTQMVWDGNSTFKAVVLGGLPSGNNFVTQGPDEVLMVLRDPPGTGSSATWSKGTTVTTTKSRTVEPHTNTELNTTIYAGVEQATAEGVGFMVIQELESKVNINAGAEINASFANMKSKTTSVTATRDISTSDGFDFNGASGDVFIGSAKNIIFGACRSVDIRWDNATSQPVLDMDEALATGEQFTTGFAYTQNYIKGVLIPNFEDLRNSLLTKVASTDGVSRPATGDPIYVTTLSEDDEKFGSSNNDASVWGDAAVPFSALSEGKYTGPSYTMILPEDYQNHDYQDMVNFYNLQIQRWKNELKKNEETKVTAIENRDKWLKQNHSFDAGATITESITTETTESRLNTEVQEINAIIGAETGYRFTGLGLSVQLTETVGVTTTEEQQRDEQEVLTTSYSLVEDGDDDYLSVDVFNAPDGFGPVFYTRAGATSCPYEDEVVTEFYKPGTVIMQKTVQIENPEIEASVQTLTGIPAGGKGTFQVYLRNNSDTKEDSWYDIMVATDSNPDGLVVKMDGMNIAQGRSVLVKAGETMNKTFTVEQSNPDVLTYENVKIRIASQCQKDNTGVFPEIADTTSFSVFFQPTCSEVKLASTHSMVNSDTETVQTLSISGYNYSMASLKGIRLQYKSLDDADFRTLQEYSKDADRVAADQNLLLLPALEGTNKLNYTIDLRKDEFADKTYVFRAITVCDQGGTEVNNESEEVTIVRDMTRPMLIATPTPTSGILTSGDDLMITFNEDIQGSILSKPNNFDVFGVLNESRVAHDVALSLTGENAAKTEAPISLAGKSFSASMWVNYQSDGTLLMHGSKENNFTATIENGKLAVSVAGTKVASNGTMPTGKWLYLNISYDAEAKTVSAGYAQDASEVALITNAEVPAYEGNGIITVGGNSLTAKVQELSLWNSARTMAEAQADMYTTKSKSTRGLIGYWQMDEGHGSTATDRARSRNMLLPSVNAWWINGDNYALALDGETAAAVNIGALNTTVSEDYLIEAWVKADETQNGVASILSTQVMDLRLNAAGKLELALNGSPVEVMNTDLRDGQWHHVAVNVLKSNSGSGIVYVDGQQRKQIAATAMPALYGDKLMLGSHRTSVDGQGLYTYDQMLKGAIDEVRIWKSRRTADVIKNTMYQRVKADETGLVAYYPMETFSLDAYNQTVSTGTMADATGENSDELTFFTAGAAATAGTTTSANTAALKPAPAMENVQFSFVASERQIKVNLEEQPYKMEGCTIYITAKNVKDVNGNSALPITWSVYVQQNNLKWQEPDVALTKTASETSTFTATIVNRGSESEAWSLSGLPAWLTTNTEGGVLKPQTTETLTFTVAESVPIGKYEQTIYLTGNNSIAEPMTLSLKVTGEEPLWAVNMSDYEETMTVIGSLSVLDVMSEDEDDMVGAFIGNECRGVARPVYNKRYDSYFVSMDIYGNGEDNNKDITFKVYDASTNIVYPVVTTSLNNAPTDVKFVANDLIGVYKTPMMFNATDEVEQNIDLAKGWNWMSLSVRPNAMTTSVVFANANGRATTVKNKSKKSEYDDVDDSWYGTLRELNNRDMFVVGTTEAFTLNVIGHRVNSAEEPVTVGSGWNWIGYNGQQVVALNEAFAGLNPQDGDIVKGQKGVAYYDEYEWIGSLQSLSPGKGYKLKSTAATTRTFTYPTSTASASRMAGWMMAEEEQPAAETRLSVFSPVDYHAYSDNMVVIAQVVESGIAVPGVELGFFAAGECREAAVTDERGMVYVTVPGNETTQLAIRVSDGQHVMTSPVTVTYSSDAVVGSPSAPLLVDLSQTTGIWSVTEQGTETIYDMSGRKIDNAQKNSLRHGVYIVNGQKVIK